ncbi:MAG: Flp family type IVb pilin [Proteobacteria bacterium]|nr:Flp family type IVb pilin [Pseudomonadota bacterium]
MSKVGEFLQQFLTDESGISSVEYALLLAFVAGGIILGADALSTAVTGEMQASADCIDGTTLAAAC